MKRKKDRYVALDTARGAAIIIIVSCHFLLFDGIHGAGAIGRAMADIGNFIFFAISAILFGLQLEKNGTSIFTFHPFLVKRLIRLFASLWPFLFVLISIYLCLQQKIGVVQGIMNFIGLGWLSSLPCNGHLWFVSMIIFCYLMYIFSAKSCYINHVRGGVKWMTLFILCSLMELILDNKRLPGYVFMILCYSFYLFHNARAVLNFLNKINLYYVCLAVIASSLLALIICKATDFTLSLFLQRFCGYLAGLSWLALLLKLGGTTTFNRVLFFLSDLSYEIYLVHHCMCCGILSVIHITNYPLLNYLILWILSIVFAFPLNRLAKNVNLFLTQKCHVDK